MDRTKAAGPGRTSPAGAPSEKNAIGTCQGYGEVTAAGLELTRFVPFSYFWTCWNVMPSAVAEPRLAHVQHHTAHTQASPTCWSMGLGDF